MVHAAQVRRRRAIGLLTAAFVAACGDRRTGPDGGAIATRAPGATASGAAATPPPSPATLDEIVRLGRLRVGFNFANDGMVRWDGRRSTGVHGQLADALALELGAQVVPSVFSSMALVHEAGRRAQWDIAFAYVVRFEPGISFSNAYCEVDQMYLVSGTSPFRSPLDVDRPGSRVATYGGTVLERYLSETLTHAKVIGTGSLEQAFRLVNDGEADAVADVPTTLVNLSPLVPGGRILPDPVTRNRGAIAVANGRLDLLRFVNTWVERAKASGVIASALAGHGSGTRVAAPGP